jgi:NADPH:quinone reductase-like Zn-dependent oxidoreductase
LKAVVQTEYGTPDVLRLEDVDTPSISENEVLVRVRGASVNPPDWAGVHGVPYIVRAAFGLRRPKLGIRGTDLAGTVEALGANVTRLSVGDEVFGVGVGTFAEYAVAKQEHLVPKPAGITFERAAATGMAASTALQALRDAGRIRAGQKVLIVGAGGGIGTFAVQIAKSFGAHVTGVCSTSKQELVRSLGADHVIDYTGEDFTRGAEHYDLILECAATLAVGAPACARSQRHTRAQRRSVLQAMVREHRCAPSQGAVALAVRAAADSRVP